MHFPLSPSFSVGSSLCLEGTEEGGKPFSGPQAGGLTKGGLAPRWWRRNSLPFSLGLPPAFPTNPCWGALPFCSWEECVLMSGSRARLQPLPAACSLLLPSDLPFPVPGPPNLLGAVHQAGPSDGVCGRRAGQRQRLHGEEQD